MPFEGLCVKSLCAEKGEPGTIDYRANVTGLETCHVHALQHVLDVGTIRVARNTSYNRNGRVGIVDRSVGSDV